MLSMRIYCQISISVQLLMGKTRKCSPMMLAAVVEIPQFRALVLGIPLAKASRWEKKRSLARAFSSSRRAPPRAASNLNSANASSSVTVCSALRLAVGPVSSTARALVDGVLHRADDQLGAQFDRPVRHGMSRVSGKLWPVSMCSSGKGDLAGVERLSRQVGHHDRVLAAGKEQHGPFKLGRDFAHHVDGFRFELFQMGTGVIWHDSFVFADTRFPGYLGRRSDRQWSQDNTDLCG